MPTAMLTLEWSQGLLGVHEMGWCVKICGRHITSNLNLTSMQFVKANTAPYFGSTGTGPVGWVLTPAQIPTFNYNKGCIPTQPPLGYIAEYLEELESHGYKVVGTHSSKFGGSNNFPILSWTLQTN